MRRFFDGNELGKRLISNELVHSYRIAEIIFLIILAIIGAVLLALILHELHARHKKKMQKGDP
jgi:hypothetical protein